MAHFLRTLASWVGITTLTEGHLESFDAKSTAAINGDGGGAYAPTDPIEIGGDGVDLQGANHEVSGTLTVTGNVEVEGSLKITTGAAVFVPAVAHTEWQPFIFTDTTFPADDSTWVEGCVGDSTLGSIVALGSSTYIYVPIKKIRHGSKLLKIRVYLTVNPAHVALPAVLPNAEILRVSQGEAIATTLGPPAAAAPADVADWNAPGISTSAYFEYTVAAVGGEPMVDTQAYWIKLRDENGANALGGNMYHGALLFWEVTNLSDVQP